MSGGEINHETNHVAGEEQKPGARMRAEFGKPRAQSCRLPLLRGRPADQRSRWLVGPTTEHHAAFLAALTAL